MYADRPVGQPPMPPAQRGLATILQAYTSTSDDEVTEALMMDQRWRLVLDRMDHATTPFAKATLGAFRTRLVAHQLDRRLVERTVELYRQTTGQVAAGKLRAALDSSPLWGLGGWRTRSIVGARAAQGRGRVGASAGVGAGGGYPSAGRAWPAPQSLGLQREGGVGSGLGRSCRAAGRAWVVLAAVGRVERWPASLPPVKRHGSPRAWQRPGRSATRTWPSTSRAAQALSGGRPGPPDLY
jgi:Transposase domain (DUF772)